ncbi:hypothetical protein LCGC14_0945000 [marine sediment metagenome]|uniref:Homing endonuclease LAGLIDADG domain-containing protein n=1 Tax=marine sediment metagenome TaxID=412755 RepID=A0A0F9RQC1_9ZZZZ
MTEVEKAWIGAMLQADGCVSRFGEQGRGYKYWRFTFTNTDIELVSTVLRLTGMGGVSYHPPPPLRPDGYPRSEWWTWELANQPKVNQLAQDLAPYCTKARKVLE